MVAKKTTALLLIEDNLGDARLLREMLNEQRQHPTQLIPVRSLGEAETLLARRQVDVILLDLGLPDAQGLDAVRRARAAAPHTPLVVLTGLDDERLAGQALHEGAQDYLIKGEIEGRGLQRAIGYAIERKRMEEALFEEKERALVTLNCIGDAVVCTDTEGRVTFVNTVAETMTGWPEKDARGRPMAEVIMILNADSREIVIDPMATAIGHFRRPTHGRPNCNLVRRDGTEVAIEDSAAPIRDRDGKEAGAVIVFRDVSEARALARQMTHSAHHDFLTGLPNRMLLSDRIAGAIAIAPRHMKQVAVLFLDLDGFKHINDSLGHSLGDRLLQSVSHRLVESVRGSDTVSRQGGDEFVILLSEVDNSEDAALTARRVLDAVARPHMIDNRELHVTTSVGVSIFPDDGPDSETLIKNADTAMYQAKESGRQGYRFFTPEMNVRAVDRQRIEEGLRRALERNEFTLQYQPKICLRTRRIYGAEALIRWTHPEFGCVAPDKFIPVAEESGLILMMGAWVQREACNQARSWADAGLPPITMAINVSAMEFREEHFLEGLLRNVEETGLDPGIFELELTESVLMKHADAAATTLRILRNKGMQIAVDDFGTGYSSLAYLHKFPVDTLKIDRSFIQQISADRGDAAIVRAVIGMAGNLNLRVVAEGVETLEQLAFLEEYKCDQAQGYYFSQPVSHEAFARLLTANGSKGRREANMRAAAKNANGMAGVR